MFRHLWHAFWARPDVPLLRLLPWNALACIGAGVAGFWDPFIWPVAGGMEFVYLLTMASHPGFQHWIDTARLRDLAVDGEDARYALLKQLGGAAKQRYKKLEEKREKVERLYKELAADDLLVDGNRDALRQLTWLFLRLLNAQRNLLILGPPAVAADLNRQIAALESELARGGASSGITQSKRATLELLRGRLENLSRREESLAEIESDLARIELQIDHALDEASLRGRPTAISARVDLISQLIDDSSPYDEEPSATTTTSSSSPSSASGRLEQ